MNQIIELLNEIKHPDKCLDSSMRQKLSNFVMLSSMYLCAILAIEGKYFNLTRLNTRNKNQIVSITKKVGYYSFIQLIVGCSPSIELVINIRKFSYWQNCSNYCIVIGQDDIVTFDSLVKFLQSNTNFLLFSVEKSLVERQIILYFGSKLTTVKYHE